MTKGDYSPPPPLPLLLASLMFIHQHAMSNISVHGRRVSRARQSNTKIIGRNKYIRKVSLFEKPNRSTLIEYSFRAFRNITSPITTSHAIEPIVLWCYPSADSSVYALSRTKRKTRCKYMRPIRTGLCVPRTHGARALARINMA